MKQDKGFSLEEQKEFLTLMKKQLEEDKILKPYLYFVGETNVENEKVKIKEL